MDRYLAKLKAKWKAGVRPDYSGPPRAVEPSVEAMLRADFGVIDESKDGYLTFDELLFYLHFKGQPVTKEQAMEMLLEIDDNEDVRFPSSTRARTRAVSSCDASAAPISPRSCALCRVRARDQGTPIVWNNVE